MVFSFRWVVVSGAVGTVENSGLSGAKEEFSKRGGNGGKTLGRVWFM
jgi:hypothetical protein